MAHEHSEIHLAALSFEMRAAESSERWLAGRSHGRLVLIDYQGGATPGDDASALRQLVEDQIREAAEAGVSVEKIHISPYSMLEMQAFVESLVSDCDLLTIDVTCMTRPHVVAVARAVSTSEALDWSVSYTDPTTYGTIAEHSPGYGWRDTLILGLGDDTSLDNQGVSLGLLLLGYDSGRIAVAFDDLEADAGLIVITESANRPDFHRLTTSRTARVVDYLRSLSLTGARGETIANALGADGWTTERIDIDTIVSDTFRLVDRLVSAAMSVESDSSKPAPIILYPFGPKIAVFCSVYWLTKMHSEASWCVYPVARTHQLDYTTGVGESHQWPSSKFKNVLL